MLKQTSLSIITLTMMSVAMPALAQTSTIDLLGADGKKTGSAIVMNAHDGSLIRIEVEGLTPGWHGVHIHAKGDCSDHTEHFAKSGGHAAEADQTHGFQTEKGPHNGDLPNLWVQENGTGKAEFYTEEMGAKDLSDTDGSALMVHADPDDNTTQPTGNAGGRVACGVISAAKAP